MKKNEFENNLDKLEKLVNDLEMGELNLDQGLKKFEEGVGLYKKCKDHLKKAEKKINVLRDNLKFEEME